VFFLTDHHYCKQHRTTWSMILKTYMFITKKEDKACYRPLCFSWHTCPTFSVKSKDMSTWEYSQMKSSRILVILCIPIMTILAISLFLQTILRSWVLGYDNGKSLEQAVIRWLYLKSRNLYWLLGLRTPITNFWSLTSYPAVFDKWKYHWG